MAYTVRLAFGLKLSPLAQFLFPRTQAEQKLLTDFNQYQAKIRFISKITSMSKCSMIHAVKIMYFACGVIFLINLVRLVSWEKEIELMDLTSLLTSLRLLSCTAL